MMGWTRWKASLVVLICLMGITYAVPSVIAPERLAALPDWIPARQVTLGLDLQGGSHLLLEVDVAAVRRERLNNLLDSVRTALRAHRIAVSGFDILPDATGITFRLRDPADAERVRNSVREIDRAVQMVAQADGTVTLRQDAREIAEQRRHTLVQSVEIVRRRIDELGTKEPTIQAQGDSRILVQVPGFGDPQRLKALLGKTAKMSFHLLDTSGSVLDARQGRVPSGSELLPSDREVETDGRPRMYLIQRRAAVSGDRLIDAQPGTNPQTGEWVVNFRFDSPGTRQFGQITRDNVGRPFAIVLDGKVITAPVIREPILGGSGQISGSFTAQSANDLAVLLRAGALPAPLTVLEERTVGPDLGSDSIRAGTIACVIGYALIVGLMIVGYGLFGIIANLALLLNLGFTLALMAGLGATLTLPGIAGMVLGLAMAVDANVLIYERMREETDQGRSPLAAVDAAFRRAMSTILDSNLTTLIAALLLYMFGSGPVRGLAVTLSIAILCSMFTAVVVTKMMVVGYLAWRRPKMLPI